MMKRALLLGGILVALGGAIFACSQVVGLPPPPPVSDDASATDGGAPDAPDDAMIPADDANDGSDAADAASCVFDLDSQAVTPISSLNNDSGQNIPAAVTPGATTVLIQRSVGSCSSGLDLFIADRIGESWNYKVQPVNPPLKMNTDYEENVTLTADGRTLIALNRADAKYGVATRFFAATRAPLSATFDDVTEDPFTQIQPEVGSGATLWAPVISADGLEFFYVVQNDITASRNGIYHSIRESTSDSFPQGTLMQDLIQHAAQYVSGITADRQTLYVEVNGSYGCNVFTWDAGGSAWQNPNAPFPAPVADLRAKPYGTCNQILATFTAKNCGTEVIARAN